MAGEGGSRTLRTFERPSDFEDRESHRAPSTPIKRATRRDAQAPDHRFDEGASVRPRLLRRGNISAARKARRTLPAPFKITRLSRRSCPEHGRASTFELTRDRHDTSNRSSLRQRSPQTRRPDAVHGCCSDAHGSRSSPQRCARARATLKMRSPLPQKPGLRSMTRIQLRPAR